MILISKGTHIKDVVFKWTKNTGKGLITYYQIKLTDVVITSMGILSPECVGGGCNNLFEEMHLNYSKIEWTGYEQGKDGSPGAPITTGWDINTNKEP
jgi:type VI secretion system Hcp family effector